MGRLRIVVLVAALAAVVTLGVVPASAQVARTEATTITVTGKEFSFTLSKKSAKVGSVTFKFTNKGKLPHDFKIKGKKTAIIGPGKSATLTVNFTKKGKYKYICTVPGHAAAGMKGTFTIT